MLIDSHIHLFREEDIPTLAWQSPTGPLYKPYDLPDYEAEISPAPANYGGFIFVETDRKYDDPFAPSEDLTAWQHVVEEYRYVLETSKRSQLVRGIVPWAPVHLGGDAMQRYQAMLEEVDKEVYGDVKHELLVGYRYLLQDKERGTATAKTFIDGLRFIASTGRVFDLGVDVNRQGLWQFEEAFWAIDQVEGLKVVINHLSKPPLGRYIDGGFDAWKDHIEGAAANENIYVKFSGVFSELPPGTTPIDGELPGESIKDMAKVYAQIIFKAFGPKRVVWGSDWPVCGIGYEEVVGTQKGVWHSWLDISRRIQAEIVEDLGLEVGGKDDWEGIWGDNALRIYSPSPR